MSGISKDDARNPNSPGPLLACVVLAHGDPVHLQRLIAALDPFPIFLHVDSRTDDATFAAMTAHLPPRCTLLRRIATGWAMWENVEAELDGYRAAIESTDATHIAILTGTDYPLASVGEITDLLARNKGISFARVRAFPHPDWRQNFGYSRLRYRHWVFRKHMLRLPIPRRLPPDVVPAGGSQLKILSREHAQAILKVVDTRPDLGKFWRRSWVPDETFVPSLLATPRFNPGWQNEHEPDLIWWIGWGDTVTKSPPWLDLSYKDQILDRSPGEYYRLPPVFARKFSTSASSELLDAIDGMIAASSDDATQRLAEGQ